ncbi:MAG: hypothetical protein R3B92_01610 [Patescibacteria group bacterium]|uniref:Uncharacterized protein n=1 Tax=candidate division WWE3 bacterium TaxID=2053526 RepID=A0A955J1K1_UNCKA|nr:hypothetical protein [candidate division WWE3 bacterium]
MYNDFLERLRTYKYGVVLLVLIFGFIILYAFYLEPLLLSPSDPNVVDPNIVTQELTYINVVSIKPPSGLRSSPNDFVPVLIELDKPFQLNSVTYEVDPKIDLRFRIYSNNENVLVMQPNGAPWKRDIRYDVKISLRGSDGSVLQKPIEYTYFNVVEDIPDDILIY